MLKREKEDREKGREVVVGFDFKARLFFFCGGKIMVELALTLYPAYCWRNGYIFFQLITDGSRDLTFRRTSNLTSSFQVLHT